MNIVFFGNGNRGSRCLEALHKNKYRIGLVVGYADNRKSWFDSVVAVAKKFRIRTAEPRDPNDERTIKLFKSVKPDLFILAGYGIILKPQTIAVPKLMCINLHAGKLPEKRGSSPMNWALINGEKDFTLSIIRIDSGIDTGDILLEERLPISADDTIRDLHAAANKQFPLMLIETLRRIEKGNYRLSMQDNKKASHYPLRFPDDGLIIWDMYTAEQVHNRIRALTTPYPCAFTFFNGRRVKLISSRLTDFPYYGEPGRIYRRSKKEGILICASDKCLWIKEAVMEDTKEPLFDVANRYDRLVTVRWSVVSKKQQANNDNRFFRY